MTKIFTLPSLWTILEEDLATIQLAYVTYLAGDEIGAYQIAQPHADVPVAGIFDVDLDRIPPSFFMNGNIGVLPIEGVITPKADFWTRLFGGATLDVMTRDFDALINDDSVKAIVLDVDSPGGVAFGVEQFANLVFEAREVKPIYSITSTMMASAAMWIGAAAEEIFITGEVVMAGSIGTVINHIDISELEKKFGVKTTEITAGRYKRISSMFKPLSEEGRAELQRQVDHVNSTFVADIARFRGVDANTVNSDMADGRIFMGSQAIEAGLIDEIIGADELIERINAEVQNSAGNSNNFIGGESMSGAITKKDKAKASEVTAGSIQENHPGVYAQIFNLGKQEANAELDTAVADALETGKKQGVEEGKPIGAEAERGRIKEVYARMTPGSEKEVAAMMFDGKTTGVECGDALYTSDKEKKGKMLTNMQDESENAVESDQDTETQAQDNADKESEKGKGFETLVASYQAEHKCSKGEAIRHVAKSHPEAHKDYVAKMPKTRA